MGWGKNRGNNTVPEANSKVPLNKGRRQESQGQYSYLIHQ